MEQLTTYTVKSKEHGFIWLFKYRLNGALKSFEIVEGELSLTQRKWLFAQANFPVLESYMKAVWIKELKKNFEVSIGLPKLDFDAFWEAYDYKVKKVAAQKAWKKLSEANRIKAFMAIEGYNKHLQRKNVAKAHPATYLNQCYFEDEWDRV